MKRVKRCMIVLLAVMMVFTFMPTSMYSTMTYAADDTDINIPIDLNGVSYTRGNAMATTLNYQEGDYIDWKRPSSYANFVNLMQSTKPEDTYICLTKDISDTWKGSLMSTIVVTAKKKVLDLNGHEIAFHVDSNCKHWTYWAIDQSPYQRDDNEMHMNTAFSIEKGANCYIIDSSARNSFNGKDGKGKVRIVGYMVNPFKDAEHTGPKHVYRHYTNFDLFNVSNGNLLIYGGNFQAGRSKAQVKSNFSWSKLKATIGKATELAVSVASYATGIEAAVAAQDDVIEGFNKIKDETDITSTNPNKNEKPENKVKDPDKKESFQTIGDKQDTIDKSGELNGSSNGNQKANDKESAKSDKNSKIAEAHKKVVDSAVNQDGIMGMVNKAFDFCSSIAGMCGSDQSTRIIQTLHGTCVRVGNKGTFVSYGGTYDAYGSTPNTRDAVVEVSKQGKAYVFDGNFNGRAGANIFAIVKPMNTLASTVQQVRRDKNGTAHTEEVTIKPSETMGLEEIFFEDDGVTPVDTSNIQVRGGNFRNYYEAKNIGIAGPDDDHFLTWYGSSGTMNLGAGSFGEDLIKDGRIQISDMFGNGALVLMDDNIGGDGKLYHYRLLCSDLELRYKQGLRVYPNTVNTNSVNSFSLKTQNQGGDAHNLDVVLSNDKENIRGAYSTTEKVFYFPINSESTEAYTITPTFKNVNVDGTNLDSSPSWYYPSPTDTENKAIEPLVIDDMYLTGTLKSSATGSYQTVDPNKLTNSFNATLNTSTAAFGGKTYVDVRTIKDTSQKNLNKVFDSFDIFTHKYNYLSNLKWLEYKVYQVDPLTRLNINKSGVIGDDQPLAVATYGSEASKGLKTMIRLTDLEKKLKAQNTGWTGFKQGEMYRITLSVEERLNSDYNGYDKFTSNTSVSDYDKYCFTNSIGTAKATSSVLFMCYGPEERTVQEGYNSQVYDYTPLQWTSNDMKAGSTAWVTFVNAKTGNVDFESNRIFDIYYQWWTVNDKGEKDQLIAGTTNVWDIVEKYKAAKEQNLNTEDMKAALNRNKDLHTFSNWLRGKDGFKYANSMAPDDPLRKAKDRNGNTVVYGDDDLPKIEFNSDGSIKSGTNLWPKDNDEASRLIHAYSTQWAGIDYLKSIKDQNLSNWNNNQDYGHYDSCYIPKQLGGKKIMVEAIVINCNWTDYYDAVQTFYSHTYQLPPRTFDEDVNGEVSIKYGAGSQYASLENPVTISLSNVSGLESDEYVTDLLFQASSEKSSRTAKLITLKKGDKYPTVKFPDDFYTAEERSQPPTKAYAKIPAGEYTFRAYIATNLDSDDAWRIAWTPEVKGQYEVAAKRVITKRDSYVFDSEDIKSGKYKSGEIELFRAYPVDYTIPIDYSKAKSTDKKVAYIDEHGCLAFGGSAGDATLTYKEPSGETLSIDVKIIDYVDDIIVNDINPPEIGKAFRTDVTIPDGVDYHVKEVYWTNGAGDRLDSGTTARNYKAYTVNIIIEKNDPTLVFRKMESWAYENYPPYTMYLNVVDPESEEDELLVEPIINNYANARTDYKENPVTGIYEEADTCTLWYTYYDAIGAAESTIHTVNMDFPTEVVEGDAVDQWLDNFIASTNGDDSEFKFTKGFTFTSFAEQTFKAYGYNVDMNDPADTMKAFMKGTVEGPKLDLDLNPEGDGFASFTNKDKLTVNVNGEPNENTYVYMVTDQLAYFTVPGAITILDGKAIPNLPKYRVKDFNLAVDEEVDLDDLLETEGDNIKLIADFTRSDPSLTNPDDPYLDYDKEKNILTAIKETSEPIVIPLYVSVDGNGDGEGEMRVNVNVQKTIYEDIADCPALDNGKDISLNVTVLNPDGSTNSQEYIKAHLKYKDSEYAELDIPNVDGAMVCGVTKPNGDDIDYKIGPWTNRLSVKAKDGESITVKTVSATDLMVKTSPTEIYPEMKGVDDLCVSLDGDHWTTSKIAFTGLDPDTEYLLYYRQGIGDIFYTKVVRTDPEGNDYGIYVGRNPVTKTELGNLERDGYHYDPSTKTLTLKNFNFCDMGIDVESFKIYYFNLRAQSVIYAIDDITIDLIGDNYIEKLGGESNFILENIIRSKNGNITFTGTGSLTLKGGGLTQAIEPGAGKNVYLKGTGKMTFEGNAIAYFVSDGGKVYYTNGELDLNSGNLGIRSTPEYEQFVTTGSTHPVKIYAGPNELVELDHMWITDAEANTIMKAEGAEYYKDVYYLHLVPQHSFTKKVEKEEYYVEGDCSKGTTYYMSCSCGAPDYEHTFTTPKGNHNLVHHDGKKATCIEDGYKAYDTCTKCDYTTFQMIPAKGHKYTHHDEVLPTCTKDGHPAYDVCSVCGYSSLEPTIQAAIDNPSADVDRDDLWVAKGHDVVYVPEVAPTNCGEVGYHEHYECVNCGKFFTDEEGSGQIKKADMAITLDHTLTKVPAKAATTSKKGNIEYYICEECGKWFKDAGGTQEITDHSSVVIPIKPSLNATKKTLKAGATFTLKVKNGTAKSWKSSAAKVAKVSTKGVVTALKKGTATITVTLKDGKTLKSKITVSTNPTITVGGKKYSSTTTYKVKKGKTLKIVITGKAASVPNVYSSSKKTVAKVTSKTSVTKPLIKGLKVGTATVTIKVNGKAFKIKVKVVK